MAVKKINIILTWIWISSMNGFFPPNRYRLSRLRRTLYSFWRPPYKTGHRPHSSSIRPLNIYFKMTQRKHEVVDSKPLRSLLTMQSAAACIETCVVVNYLNACHKSRPANWYNKNLYFKIYTNLLVMHLSFIYLKTLTNFMHVI